MPSDFLAEMRWRGQLHQVTHEEALAKHLGGGVRRAYVGFDPTADSLTIGNLVGIMALAKWQRAGHIPVAVMGGGTGQIGDPSGKSAERQLMTRERIAANVERIRRIFEPLLDFSAKASNRAVMVDNVEWLGKLTYLDALRDIGKHFSVNMMIQKDSVRERLHHRDQGISYTEFSYMILQSYDFLHLFREMGVTVQMGGSDQWGNIVGGTDLIRRMGLDIHGKPLPTEGQISQFGDWEPGDPIPAGYEAIAATANYFPAKVFAITWPLVTKADGGKFGKTESGAIWLTAERTSSYGYYQFWLNAADSDAVKFLKTFTLLPKQRIDALEASHAADPSKREAQRELAREATALLHGPTERDAAEAAAAALFSGDVASLSKKVLEEVMAEVPSSRHDKALLGAGMPLVDLLPLTTLAKSKREAKEFLGNGSVTVNGKKAGAEDKVTSADLLHGEIIALRRGKKSWHVTRWG